MCSLFFPTHLCSSSSLSRGSLHTPYPAPSLRAYHCSVYPGHGSRFVTRTGLLVVLGGSKVVSLYHQRKKPAKLYWTLASRRAHKKLNTEAGAKKRARRVVIKQRGYVGMADGATIEAQRKLNEDARRKAAAAAPAAKAGGAKVVVMQAAVAEAKARQKAAQAERKKSGGGARAGGAAPAAAKHAGKGR